MPNGSARFSPAAPSWQTLCSWGGSRPTGLCSSARETGWTGGAAGGLAGRAGEHQALPAARSERRRAHLVLQRSVEFPDGEHRCRGKRANKLLARIRCTTSGMGSNGCRDSGEKVRLQRRFGSFAPLPAYMPDGSDAELLRAQIAQLEKHRAKANQDLVTRGHRVSPPNLAWAQRE